MSVMRHDRQTNPRNPRGRRWIAALTLGLAIVACGNRAPVETVPSDGRRPLEAGRFDDYAPHAWDGAGPDRYAIHGIDVARYQGTIDWQQVRRAGISFAYIKATEGADLLDPRFKENWRNARRAGIPRGAYHFYYFCRSPEEQADWYIRNVPRRRGDLPPVLDIEWNHTSRTCQRRPAAHVTRAEMHRFLAALTRHYGTRPVIYTTIDFWRDNDLSHRERLRARALARCFEDPVDARVYTSTQSCAAP